MGNVRLTSKLITKWSYLTFRVTISYSVDNWKCWNLTVH